MTNTQNPPKKPDVKPIDGRFSAGPARKRPDWDPAEVLKDAALGRSHRSAIGKAKLKELYTKESKINSSSGSRVKVSCTQSVVAKASSGSHIDIYKKGNNFKFKKSESSGGAVNLN